MISVVWSTGTRAPCVSLLVSYVRVSERTWEREREKSAEQATTGGPPVSFRCLEVLFVEVEEDAVLGGGVLATHLLQVLANDGSSTKGDANVGEGRVVLDHGEDSVPVWPPVPHPQVLQPVRCRSTHGHGLFLSTHTSRACQHHAW